MQPLLRATAVFALLALALAAAAPAARAQEVVIDFGARPSYSSVIFGPSYSEDGFTVTSSGPANVALGKWGENSLDYAGSTALYSTYGNTSITLTRDSGRAFTLDSIDLAELFYTRGGQSPSVTFTGTLAGGGTVTQTFTLDGINTFRITGVSGFETFSFGPGFTNLVSVTWQQGGSSSNAYQFDSVRLNVTPDPATRISDLNATVRGLGLPKGIENSFVVKLEAALAALEAGDTEAARDSLQSFINHARAQSGKKLPAVQAGALIAEAEAVLAALAGP